MIKTTMANHINKGVPGVREHGNLGGHPGSRSVIRTTMKKTGGRADNFVKKTANCKTISGGPGTKFVDMGSGKGKQA